MYPSIRTSLEDIIKFCYDFAHGPRPSSLIPHPSSLILVHCSSPPTRLGRHWETMLCGAIPIVLHNDGANQTGLFDGLPVVTVRNWEDVTLFCIHK